MVFFRSETVKCFGNGQPALHSNAAQRTRAKASGSITVTIGAKTSNLAHFKTGSKYKTSKFLI